MSDPLPRGDSPARDSAAFFIRAMCWLVALVLGALQAWAGRFPIGEDGLSYLDIADAYLRGDWRNALNAYWSPVYSWIMAAAFALTRPSPFMESTIVHAVNFLIFVCALAAFDFLLRQLLAGRRADPAAARGEMRLPDGAFVLLACSLFIWVSIEWISVSLESPDMCLTVFVYLAAGLLVRMRLRPPSTRTFALFGVVLALAALTKSAMFPLSAVFLALAAPLVPRRRVPWHGVGVAIAVFVLVAGPFVAAISLLKGRITFGDTGRLAYVWFANGATDRELHWSREFPDDQRPVHPTRKIFERPVIYEFGSDPVGGAYPIWYDPSYWHEGETPHFDLRGQLRVLKWSAQEWWHLLLDDGAVVLFAGFILLAAAFTGWAALGREIVDHAELFVPAAAAAAMYSLVLMSPRYVAVFLLLGALGVFASVRLPRLPTARRLGWAVALGILLLISLRLAPLAAGMIDEVRGQAFPGAHRYFEVARGLQGLGARPGDAVARIGYGPPAYWARLARVRIVAEMFGEAADFVNVPDIEHALHADGSFKPEILDAFRGAGARFLIAWKPPPEVARHGWHELGEHSQWFALPVPPPGAAHGRADSTPPAPDDGRLPFLRTRQGHAHTHGRGH